MLSDRCLITILTISNTSRFRSSFIRIFRAYTGNLSVSLRTKNGRQTLFQLAGGGGGVFKVTLCHPLSSRWPLTPSSNAFNVHHLYSPPPTKSGCLPERNSFMYTFWNEPQSEEPPRWYLAKVTYISDNGNAVIHYKRGSLEEAVNLLNASWVQAKGNGKWFFPISSTSPVVGASTPKIPKVKSTLCERFADDLTIIYQHEHASVLGTLSKKCSDIDLEIRPDKCQ